MTLEDILFYELFLHNNLEFVDLFKLIYQAAYGPSHLAGVNKTNLYDELTKEWDSLDCARVSQKEPLFQIISPDMFVCRINLRTFKSLGGDIEAVWELMEKSLKTKNYPSYKLENYLNILVEFVKKSGNIELIAGLENFMRTYDFNTYPVVHHSRRYIETYNPSYRVVILSNEPVVN